MRHRKRVSPTAAVLGLLCLGTVGCDEGSLATRLPPSTPPALVTPDLTATSACEQSAMYAETTKAYTYLLGCSGQTLKPAPVVAVQVGRVVQIAGTLASDSRLSAPTSQRAISIEGTTITGLAPGRVTVTATGVSCFVDTGTPPASCPLLTVVVSR